MKKHLLLTLSSLGLAACASIISGQTQEITVLTPGAENALCKLDNGGNLYDVYTGQTVNVKRAAHDMAVNCLAAGNREKTVHVKWEGNGWVVLNVANGFVPGTAYDVLSQGAFAYPDTITVDFTREPVRPYELPKYHSPDLRYNNEFNLGEYMGPTTVEVPTDTRKSTLQEKQVNYNQSPFQEEANTGAVYTEPVVSYDPKEEEK